MSRNYKILNSESAYFLTLTTVDWIDVFTRQAYRDLLLDSMRYCQQEKGLSIYAWCIMSNHVHLIARAEQGNLTDILRDLKKFTSKSLYRAIAESSEESRSRWITNHFQYAGRINAHNSQIQVWQQHSQPIELFSKQVTLQKLDYIHQNPVKAGIVENVWEYLYSSARDYAGMKGLLSIELI